MSTNFNADAGTDYIAASMTEAANEFEGISAEAAAIAADFELHGWAGLDGIQTGRAALDAARPNLVEIAERIRSGGAAIRAARLANPTAARADGESLGRT